MKRIALFLLLIVFSLEFLLSCGKTADAYAMLTELVDLYGAEGVIYYSSAAEGEEGYMSDGLFEKLYVMVGYTPRNYAIFINSHVSTASECAAFVCRNSDEATAVTEMCEERVRLLTRGGDSYVIIRTGKTVFYSTMTDTERTERLWRKIVTAHT